MTDNLSGRQPTQHRENHEQIIRTSTHWVEQVVIGLNLCPFARRELESGRVFFRVTDTADSDHLLVELAEELTRLHREPRVETTLLIHPYALTDFYVYNDFLGHADRLLEELDLRGIMQIASFHPDYCFAGVAPSAAENYSNRSPYPMLHLLREDSVSRAVDLHPSVDAIPAANIATLEKLGARKLEALRQACFAHRSQGGNESNGISATTSVDEETP